MLNLSYENEIPFTCKLNSFSYEWLRTRPRFEREALGNSEMVYSNQLLRGQIATERFRLLPQEKRGKVNKPTTRNTRGTNDFAVHAKRLARKKPLLAGYLSPSATLATCWFSNFTTSQLFLSDFSLNT